MRRKSSKPTATHWVGSAGRAKTGAHTAPLVLVVDAPATPVDLSATDDAGETWTVSADWTHPTAVSGLAATPGQERLTVRWDELPDEGIERYRLYRGDDVAAMGEGEDRKLESEVLREGRVHGVLLSGGAAAGLSAGPVS